METKILIVDDHPTNLQLLRDTLETEDYTIAIASDGEMALKLVQRHLPALIILDIVMPGLDGMKSAGT
jgi:CheY-like chemotaxis protein